MNAEGPDFYHAGVQTVDLSLTPDTVAVDTDGVAVEAPAPTERKKAPAVKVEDVQFGEIRTAAADRFERETRGIADDHPLMRAFRRSYDLGAGIDVESDDPVALTKILRRIANQEGKGVAVKHWRQPRWKGDPPEGIVAFKAQPRKKVVRKKPSADADD